MFVELVDILRCPNEHEETWLVAATSTTRNRHIIGGELGCPICGERYPVRNGVVIFGNHDATSSGSEAATDDDRVVRMAALLNLDSPTGVVLLGPSHWTLARALHEATGVAVIQLDPPAHLPMGDGLSGVAGAAPLAANSIRGAAGVVTRAVVRALKANGRLVAPVQTPLPAGVKELARDDAEWVAETSGAGAPVTMLRRA